MKTAEKIAVAIYRERIARDWPRETLAYRSGLSHNTIYRMERGDSCSTESVARVLEVLGLDLKITPNSEKRIESVGLG